MLKSSTNKMISFCKSRGKQSCDMARKKCALVACVRVCAQNSSREEWFSVPSRTVHLPTIKKCWAAFQNKCLCFFKKCYPPTYQQKMLSVRPPTYQQKNVIRHGANLDLACYDLAASRHPGATPFSGRGRGIKGIKGGGGKGGKGKWGRSRKVTLKVTA